MNWFNVISGTAFALLFAFGLLRYRMWKIRSGKQQPQSVTKLIQERDAFLFMAVFLNLWVFFVAPSWDWSLGDGTSGLYISVFCVASGWLASWLLHRSDKIAQ